MFECHNEAQESITQQREAFKHLTQTKIDERRKSAVKAHFCSLIARSDDNSNGDCIDEAAEQCLEEMSHYTLMPHELLYLLCNCADRLKMIVDNHKVAHRDSKHAIYRWDLIQSKDNKPAVSNIHVLGRTAFVN